MAQTLNQRWTGLFTLLLVGTLAAGTAMADGFGRDGRPGDGREDGRFGDRFGGDRQELAQRLANSADQLFRNVTWADVSLDLKAAAGQLNAAAQATAFCFSRGPRMDDRGPGRPGWGGGWGPGRRCDAEVDFAKRMIENVEMQARNAGPMGGQVCEALRELRFMVGRLDGFDDHGGGGLLSVAGVIERFPYQFTGRSAGEIQAQCEGFARQQNLWNVQMYEIYGARYFGPMPVQVACNNIAAAAQVQRR